MPIKFEVFWKNPGYAARPELKKDIECDYLIVGGGITGVSAAYFLAKAGKKNIVLIEKHYIGSGATGKAAGTLVIRGENDLEDILKKYGREGTEKYWKEVHESLKSIKRIIRSEQIDCDDEPQDTLYCSSRDQSYDDLDLRKEYQVEKSIEGSTQFLEEEELRKEINTDLFLHGILSTNHGLSVNPLKMAQNLSAVVQRCGVTIYENTTFLKTSGNRAETHHGSISYKKILFAMDADYPSEEVHNQKSTIVITRPLIHDELVKTGLIKKKIIFNNKTDYHYLKLTKERRLLFGFGTTIVNKQQRETDPHALHMEEIKGFIKNLFPYLDLDLEYAWSGHFGVTRGYHPVVEYTKNTASIAGAGSQVVCFMAAHHIANKFLGKESPLDEFFTGKQEASTS